MRSALVSGASVAGPALAYWLQRYGFDVTVVERADAIRGGGYPIDIRGTAIEVVDRMGILPQLRAAHIDTRRLTLVDRTGRRIASLAPGDLAGGPRSQDLELPRGDLTTILSELTADTVEYVFGDSISALDPVTGHVRFEHGASRTFDVVVGADGLHSATRRLAFGPEAGYQHHLGFCFAGFAVPNIGGLSHEVVLQNTPDHLTALYAVGSQPSVGALLAYAGPPPPREESPAEIHDRFARAFAGIGGETPRVLSHLAAAEDLYADTVSQIRMPAWVTGRVALVGDAAYAPSFLSGQGTSLALTGAYVLAGELSRAEAEVALPAYEASLRDHVARNQDLAGPSGSGLLPRTKGRLWLRNQVFRLAPLIARTGIVDRVQRRATASFALPEYATAGRR